MNMVTIILLGESSSGEVSADLRMAPLDDDDDDDELPVTEEAADEEEDDDEVVGVVEAELAPLLKPELEVEVGEPAEVAAGEVEDEEVEAVESADESDELLSERADELSVSEAVS